MFGCLNTIFRTITATVVSLVTFIVFVCVVCAGIIVVIGLARNAESERVAEELNNGFGTEDNPVPAGGFIRFDEGDVSVTQVDRDATRAVMDYSVLNDNPATGAVWTAVRFDVICRKDTCHQREIAFWLLDSNGNEYGESIFMQYRDKLDDAVRGATMSGWQIFEVPADVLLTGVRIRWGGVTLYLDLP